MKDFSEYAVVKRVMMREVALDRVAITVTEEARAALLRWAAAPDKDKQNDR